YIFYILKQYNLHAVRPSLVKDSSKGQESRLTRFLYLFPQFSLMISARARHPPGHDLAALGNEVLEKLRILVVNAYIFILTEPANSSLYIDSLFPTFRPWHL